MSNQSQLESMQRQTPREEASTPMRMLAAEELVEVVGGPIIDNGGGGINVMTNVAGSTGG
jgi:hypothetical protein